MQKLFEGKGSITQAEAVKAYLSRQDGLECSYGNGDYQARPYIAEWHNCRETGFVVVLPDAFGNFQQLCIAFFEHRNSDSICAVEWEQHWTLNPPTIDSADFGGAYADKWDVAHSVEFGRAGEMADWIYSRLETWWQTQKATTEE